MDQARVDQKIKVDRKVKKEEGGLWETVKVVLQALLIALVVRTLALPALQHPVRLAHPDAPDRRLPVRLEILLRLLEALDPLQPASFLRAGSLVEEPKRGDIAVFKLPKDNSTDYIKRVIGLAGRPHPGRATASSHINGAPVKRERIQDYQTQDPIRPHVLRPAIPRNPAGRDARTRSSSATATAATGTTPYVYTCRPAISS